ncbi:hypothetical protein V6L78_24540 [Pseudomonas canadensis]
MGDDLGVINGTFDCSYLECRVCGEENYSHPSPGFYVCEPDHYEH